METSPMRRRTDPYFFCFAKKWLSSLTQNMQEQRSLR
nr:MAG TPA: hypothetical protein [Caudoviricetes sp.]